VRSLLLQKLRVVPGIAPFLLHLVHTCFEVVKLVDCFGMLLVYPVRKPLMEAGDNWLTGIDTVKLYLSAANKTVLR
jgi:hypothetical protein